MLALNMIVGPYKEPFIKAAVDSSLELVSEMVFVDTAPGNNPSRPFLDFLKESTRMPVKIIDLPRNEDKDFSFAAARETARMNSDSPWVLRLDADEVFHEKDMMLLKHTLWEYCVDYEAIELAFYHHMIYPKYYQYVEAKPVFLKKDTFHWERGVHELQIIDGKILQMHKTRFHHYGYCRGQAEVFKRWQLYVDIDGKPGWYKGRDPNNILTDRLSVCLPFKGTHPKYVMPTLSEMFDASEIL